MKEEFSSTFQNTANLQRDFREKVVLTEAPTFGEGFRWREGFNDQMYIKEGGRRHKFGKKCRHFGVHEPLALHNNQYVYASSLGGYNNFGNERIISSTDRTSFTSGTGYATGVPLTTGIATSGLTSGLSSGYTTSSSTYTSGATTYGTGLAGNQTYLAGASPLAGTGGQFID